MIVPMSRVLLVGPRPISSNVIKSLHRMGKLHISQLESGSHIRKTELDRSETDSKFNLERLLQELVGMLALLAFNGSPDQVGHPSDWEEYLAELIVKRLEINELIKNRLEAIDELLLVENYRTAFEALSPLMSKLETSHKIRVFGFMAKASESSALDTLYFELKKLTQGRVELYRQQFNEKNTAVLVAFHINDAERVRGFFAKAGINELKLPTAMSGLGMTEAVSQLKEKSRKLPLTIAEIEKKLADISRKEGPIFEAYRRKVKDELDRLKAKEDIQEGMFTFYLQGYLPKDDLPALQKLINTKFGDKVTVHEIDIGHSDNSKTPVVLKNNPLVKPFELLLSIFTPPQYGSIDPTPFIAIFSPIYFGFIVGDVGYGAVVMMASIFFFSKYGDRALFKSLATIFILCSFWTIIFGVIFGELFGEVGEHLHIIKPIAENFNRMKKESVFLLLGIALGFGVIQIFTGFIIALINGIRQHDRHRILEPLGFMAGLLSIFAMIACFVGFLPKVMLVPSIILFAASAGLTAWLVGVVGPIEIFGAFGNILSYARLFAIGLSAVYLAFAANTLGNLIGMSGKLWTVILGTVLAALIFHPLFFIVGLISPIVQPARLQFVEFFTKFKYFDNPGKQYKPFKTTGGE